MIRFERSLTLGEVYRFLFVEVLSYQVLVVTYVRCVWNTPEAKKKLLVEFLIKDRCTIHSVVSSEGSYLILDFGLIGISSTLSSA